MSVLKFTSDIRVLYFGWRRLGEWEFGWMQDKVLISGFEPFDGDTVNPAREVLSLLEGRVLNGHRVVTVEIPTVRFLATKRL